MNFLGLPDEAEPLTDEQQRILTPDAVPTEAQ